MEKSAEFQIKVFNDNGTLFMRSPGGNITPYDYRFGDLTSTLVNKGDYVIFPIEDENGRT